MHARTGVSIFVVIACGKSLVSAFVPSAYLGSIDTLPSSLTFINTNAKIHRKTLPKLSQINASTSNARITTSLNLQLEDIIYNAQSTASNMATSSLSTFTSSDPTAGIGAFTASITSLAILYFAGLLTSFSPCSLSLLPLTMSYISSAAGDREDRNVVLPTLAFASGLAAVFCGLGLSASLLGGVFGGNSGAEDNLLGAFVLAALSSGVSIAMGLQLLELVNLPLPSLELNLGFNGNAISSGGGGGTNNGDGECVACSQIAYDQDGNILPSPTSSSATNTGKGRADDSKSDTNSLFRTFLLGGSSALVASPCATPVLTSILAFVAVTKDPTLGAILLLTYTVGYSTPLLVVAASGGQALVNLQNGDDDGGGVMAKIGQLVNPLTASVLIWYGTNGFLEALFGDPSLAGLAPVFE